ncbi:MAG: universal stress protein [Actinomycetota bacterium]|nr:universal stress protein [Actinomycetota bacterium]
MAYMQIVLGTDGSAFALSAERVAARLAGTCGAKLLIVQATEGTPDEAVLGQAAQRAAAVGVEAETAVEYGGAADVLIEIADRREADLIVLGSRALSERSEILGSASRKVAHNAPCDLLLVRERASGEAFAGSDGSGEGSPYHQVLIATDGSSTADRASRKGFDLASRLKAAVTLVFVGHPKTGELVLEDTVASIGSGVDAKLHVMQGDPAEQIIAAAEADGVDLLIVGNKGIAGVKGMLLGSVPQKISEYAPCDVLIARTVTQMLSELKKGEGGIVTSGNRKVAAYRDKKGNVVALSAKCTHMGCTVGWNSATKTWDCPCHGSRYTPSGEVIQGPAAKPLEKTDL